MALEADGKRLYYCEQTDPSVSVYVWQQNAFALYLLFSTEDDPAWKALYGRALDRTASLDCSRVGSWLPWFQGPHAAIIPWQALIPEHQQDGLASFPEYHTFVRHFRETNPAKSNDDRHLRQAVEALTVIMLVPDGSSRQSTRDEAWRLFTVDYGRSRTCHPLASVEGAYWRRVAYGLFPG